MWETQNENVLEAIFLSLSFSSESVHSLRILRSNKIGCYGICSLSHFNTSSLNLLSMLRFLFELRNILIQISVDIKETEKMLTVKTYDCINKEILDLGFLVTVF